jgi:hypothetical protein
MEPTASMNDTTCFQQSVPPRLTFQAHSAPIDGKFDRDFKNMYVTLHGSWNRSPATGYKVVVVPFSKTEKGYEPVARASEKGYTDILWSENVDSCASTTCLRPSGLVWDSAFTRMFVASDSRQGEIFMLYKTTRT